MRVSEIVQPDMMQSGKRFVFFMCCKYGFLEEVKSNVSDVAP